MSRVSATGRIARFICLGSLCLFGVIYAITSNLVLFQDSDVGRPRVVQILGPVGMLSIPVALVSGMVWSTAAYVVHRRRKTLQTQHDHP